MYLGLLHSHNLLRWIVLIAAVVALLQVYRSWRGKGTWSPADTRAGLFFTISLHVQLLVGFLLFAISPLTTTAFINIGAAMQNSVQRFFLVEHTAVMILAVVLAQIGFSLGRKRGRPATATAFYALAILAMIVAIPWPGLIHGRPLFPGM